MTHTRRGLLGLVAAAIAGRRMKRALRHWMRTTTLSAAPENSPTSAEVRYWVALDPPNADGSQTLVMVGPEHPAAIEFERMLRRRAA